MLYVWLLGMCMCGCLVCACCLSMCLCSLHELDHLTHSKLALALPPSPLDASLAAAADLPTGGGKSDSLYSAVQLRSNGSLSSFEFRFAKFSVLVVPPLK